MEFTIGSTVRITTMGRTDAIGRIVAVDGNRYVVRLANWQADGYHLDVACYAAELKAATAVLDADADAEWDRHQTGGRSNQ